MAFSIPSLPLVLAGPMLRRVLPQSVTVWVALKAAQTVTLQVLASDRTTVLLSGTRSTVEIGANLHVVAVEALPVGSASLMPDQLYHYNLLFGGGQADLQTPLILNNAGGSSALALIGYVPPGQSAATLPSFALPPTDINELRIVHGSCRKAHAPGLDALRTLDVFLAADAFDPINRPHQLFLTGDQIYADDVADALLHLLMEAGDALLGFVETLPTTPPHPASQFRPGRRKGPVEQAAFTTGEPRSHLLSFAEYCAMYLFAWSPVVWPDTLPTYEQVYPNQPRTVERGRQQSKHPDLVVYDNQFKPLKAFKDSVGRVRRALANVPTYMLPDDHEVTDDWYLHRGWADRVFGNALGLRIVQHGLAGYLLFQGWGNTPEQFVASGPIGTPLFTDLGKWVKSGFSESSLALVGVKAALPLPRQPTSPNADFEIHVPNPPEPVLRLDYTIRWTKHQVIALDTRTWRRYPRAKALQTRAILLTEAGLNAQLGSAEPAPADGFTLVLCAGPVLGIPLVEQVIGIPEAIVDGAFSYATDGRFEGMRLDPGTYERFLARLATLAAPSQGPRKASVVILSGDVHYGFAGWIRYSSSSPHEVPAPNPPVRADAVFVQLVSSAIKNNGPFDLTGRLHRTGFKFFSGIPQGTQRLGWRVPTPQTRRFLNVGETTNPASGFPVPIVFQGNYAVVEDTEDAVAWYDTVRLTRAPDMIARSLLGLSTDERATPTDIRKVNSLSSDRPQRLQQVLDASFNHTAAYTDREAPGKQIVGLNNLATIRVKGFSPGGPETSKRIVQEMWWWIEEPKDLYAESPQNPLLAAPLTRYDLPLGVLPPIPDPVILK